MLAASKASIDANIYTAVVLALATGARAGNIRNLTGADVVGQVADNSAVLRALV